MLASAGADGANDTQPMARVFTALRSTGKKWRIKRPVAAMAAIKSSAK